LPRFGPLPLWGRFLGSPPYIERSSRVAVDAAGNAYVLGVTGHLLGARRDQAHDRGPSQRKTDL